MKKFLAHAAVFAAFFIDISAVHAQQYPVKPITAIVPNPAGGGIDLATRFIAPYLQQRLGQPVVVENKPGAAGAIGTEFVVHSAPDGHTLLFTSDSLVTTFATSKSPPYHPINDLEPITATLTSSYLLVANPSLGVNTLAEFIAKLKEKPGQYIYASSGMAGVTHLATEHFLQKAGLEAVHVPLRGSGPMIPEILSGRVQFAFLSLNAIQDYLKDGTLIALATSDTQRQPDLPDLPTFAEAGLPDFNIVTSYTVFAPKGTPDPIIQKLNQELVDIVKIKEVQDYIYHSGGRPLGASAADLKQILARETDKWTELVKTSNFELK